MSDIFSAIFSTEGLLIGTIIPFLFVLTVVVFVHEMGHYLVGRWCASRHRISIDFGPELLAGDRLARAGSCAPFTGGRVEVRRRHERHQQSRQRYSDS